MGYVFEVFAETFVIILAKHTYKSARTTLYKREIIVPPPSC